MAGGGGMAKGWKVVTAGGGHRSGSVTDLVKGREMAMGCEVTTEKEVAPDWDVVSGWSRQILVGGHRRLWGNLRQGGR